MENVKVRIFESRDSDKLEDQINFFINEEIDRCNVIDIKFQVNSNLDADGDTEKQFSAMILYQ